VSTRQQNEKFPHWIELPKGGRQYWLDVAGHRGWWARYVKEVNAQEQTTAPGQTDECRLPRLSYGFESS